MNLMLGRLEQAQDRQRRFVADVSHDLRSPLTAQRTQLEVAVAHPESVDHEQLHRDLLGHVDEMDALVGDLLFVVTDDERPRTRQPLDLEDVVLEEAARVRRLGGPDVDTSRVSAAPVVGDAGELRRLVRNLLENAVAHAHGRIELRASSDAGTVSVDVVDDGPGVPVGEEESVFERFHRGDAARSRRGTGLGLSIARTIAERHGGTLVLVRDEGPGAHFRLTLPHANAVALSPDGALADGMLSHERSGPSGAIPLLLVHAGIADRRMWDPIWPTLTATRDVVRVDLRGFGESTERPEGPWSPRADVLEVLDAPRHRPGAPGRAARSGPASALEVALERPGLAASLVLAAPGGALLTERTDELAAAWEARGEGDRGRRPRRRGRGQRGGLGRRSPPRTGRRRRQPYGTPYAPCSDERSTSPSTGPTRCGRPRTSSTPRRPSGSTRSPRRPW